MALFTVLMTGVTALQLWGPPEAKPFAPILMLGAGLIAALVGRITRTSRQAVTVPRMGYVGEAAIGRKHVFILAALMAILISLGLLGLLPKSGVLLVGFIIGPIYVLKGRYAAVPITEWIGWIAIGMAAGLAATAWKPLLSIFVWFALMTLVYLTAGLWRLRRFVRLPVIHHA